MVAPSERSRGAGDAAGQIEVEQKILAEAFPRGKPQVADDVAKRRQPVGCAQGAASAFRRIVSARRKASIRLRGLGSAGAGERKGRAVVRRGAHEGKPERDVDAGVESERLDRDQRLVVIHRHGHVVALARLGVEQRIGGVGARSRRGLGAAPPRWPAQSSRSPRGPWCRPRRHGG